PVQRERDDLDRGGATAPQLPRDEFDRGERVRLSHGRGTICPYDPAPVEVRGMRLTRRAFLQATAATGLAVACAPAAAPAPTKSSIAPTKGGNLIIASAADLITLDPMGAGDGPSNNAMRHIYETLVVEDEDLKLVPGLATSWELSGDKVYTFKLRQGVKFHD